MLTNMQLEPRTGETWVFGGDGDEPVTLTIGHHPDHYYTFIATVALTPGFDNDGMITVSSAIERVALYFSDEEDPADLGGVRFFDNPTIQVYPPSS